MNKKQTHFEALGYEPLRMKPVHFASGFFTALTDEVYKNEVLNKVAVTKANKGLLEDYAPEAVLNRLREDELIADNMTQEDVELLRIQVNGIVNNDSAMYPAFSPYRQKGNDYTFISRRVLTKGNRTDGYAGHFVINVLSATDIGNTVLDFARDITNNPPGTLEHFVNPLLDEGQLLKTDLSEKYEREYGNLSTTRIEEIARQMQIQTKALERLCTNLVNYSSYRQIRYIILGLLAWLMSYLLKTASFNTVSPLLLFDFLAEREGPIRTQSQICYARLRETVGRMYWALAEADRFTCDPIAKGLFTRKNRENESDFRFLEQHFGDVALRMGYAQPRASRISQKYFDLQPDTLRVIMLSILHIDASKAMTFDEVCKRLGKTWNIVIGGTADDAETLREQGYSGFDESDLQHNTNAFINRLKSLNLAIEPSDGLVLCSKDSEGVI